MKNFVLAAAAVVVVLSSPATRADEERFFTHKAVSGDSLERLADRYLVKRRDWQTLQKHNALSDPHQIPLGKIIKIPVSAMRTDSVPVEVIATKGVVSSSSGAVSVGSKLKEGDKLTTPEGGFVTVKLADGSTLTVQPKSSVRVETARQLVNSGGVTDTVMRLESGRVETSVAKQKHASARYEIRTPTSNMGVRGTMFRVGADESGKRAQSEVVEGLVAIASAGPASATSASLPLKAGFGTFVEAGKPPAPPVVLLSAPDVSKLPAKIQKTDARFVVAAVSGATGYRAQLASDSTFNNLLANAASATPEIDFNNLPDGAFFLRVRGVDVNGLEGNDASHAFTVKALPLPPALIEPKDQTRLLNEKVTLLWQAAPKATGYKVQVAEDANFTKTNVDEQVQAGVTLSPPVALKSIPYFWRVASLSADGEVGSWSQPQSFLGATNAPTLRAKRVSGNAPIEIEGSTAESHQVHIARDDRFTNIASDRAITGNKFEVTGLATGAYYIRVRAAVGDKGTGTWSEPRLLEIYPFGGGWWLSESGSAGTASQKK